MPGWVTQGYEEYAKRLSRDVKLKLIEVEMAKRGKTGSADNFKIEEAKKIRKVIGTASHVVALDVKGKQWSTEKLSERMDHWMHLGKEVNLIIGGPDGIEKQLINEADETWSLSNLTYPHPLVRIIISEQIYRAWSLLNNHPYHRA